MSNQTAKKPDRAEKTSEKFDKAIDIRGFSSIITI